MLRIAALLVVAFSLAACDVVSTLKEGMKYSRAVEDDLQASTGIKPEVGFNWTNGRLTVVTVMFPRLYDAKPLAELAAMVRRSVISQFKQTPETIMLDFSLGNSASDKAAQLPAPAVAATRSSL
jgi:hypothetical protein